MATVAEIRKQFGAQHNPLLQPTVLASDRNAIEIRVSIDDTEHPDRWIPGALVWRPALKVLPPAQPLKVVEKQGDKQQAVANLHDDELDVDPSLNATPHWRVWDGNKPARHDLSTERMLNRNSLSYWRRHLFGVVLDRIDDEVPFDPEKPRIRLGNPVAIVLVSGIVKLGSVRLYQRAVEAGILDPEVIAAE